MRIEITRNDLKKEFRTTSLKDVNLSHVLPEVLRKTNNSILILSEGKSYWQKKILLTQEEFNFINSN